MVQVIPGTTTKTIASKQICQFFEQTPSQNGVFYTGYPIIGTANGAFPIDSILLSPTYGIVIINLIEGKDKDGYEDLQDESYNKMEAKLKNYKELTDKKNLIVPISVVTFAPAIHSITENSTDADYPIYTQDTIGKIFDDLSTTVKSNSMEEEDFKKVVSVVQSISTVRKNTSARKTTKSDSRGTILKGIEDSIANLDVHQSRAVIETVDGVQRIRGLAGSGKTVILALKAAYLHAQHPDWKIAVTFNTRALKNQIKEFISTFYIEQTNQYPDWDNLNIIHAWGAPGGGEKDGLYYQFCKAQDINTYKDFRSASLNFGYENAFEGACREALQNMSTPVGKYDVILVDEAQDFSKYFFRICYNLIKRDKRLVYAYDELQSLTGNNLPSPEKLFGKDEAGRPLVKFDPVNYPSQDIVLETCYRNPRPILVTAHALGFGIYRDEDSRIGTGLVQMFDNKDLWEEVGYNNESGTIDYGKPVLLKRGIDSSPRFLENHSPVDDLIVFKKFADGHSQANWLIKEIKKNLEKDELLPKDIIVINPDPKSTKDAVGYARKELFSMGINSHIAGVSTSPDEFYSDNSVTFTGIYRAKGNEAAMVYVINAQDCFKSLGGLQTVRNRLFTAITRSKAWVRVIGVGNDMEGLISEYEKVKSHDFTLDFTYPTEEQLQKIKLINRDMSEAEKNQVIKVNEDIGNVVSSLNSGRINIKDISEEQRIALIQLAKQLNGEE